MTPSLKENEIILYSTVSKNKTGFSLVLSYRNVTHVFFFTGKQDPTLNEDCMTNKQTASQSKICLFQDIGFIVNMVMFHKDSKALKRLNVQHLFLR